MSSFEVTCMIAYSEHGGNQKRDIKNAQTSYQKMTYRATVAATTANPAQRAPREGVMSSFVPEVNTTGSGMRQNEPSANITASVPKSVNAAACR